MKIGSVLLGVWLVMHGLTVLIKLNYRYDDLVMGALALAAGVFVIIRR